MRKLLFLLLFPFLTYGQVQIGQDIDGEAPFDASGRSVSLSSNGTILAIGAPENDGNGNLSGHVRVFENQNNNWVQIGQDIDGENSINFSGFSVSLSSDGTILAIGATSNNSTGHIRVFENQNNNWIQIGQDIDGTETSEGFGQSVTISNNGTIVAIGAPGNNNNGESSGRVQVYENQGGVWNQIGQDIYGTETLSISGYSVNISSDGTILAVGSPGEFANENFLANVKVYELLNNNWVQIGNDINAEVVGDESGTSISLSSDGTILAIGAPRNNTNGDRAGQVRVFENQNNNWIQIGNDINGNEPFENLGSSVSLSENGSVLSVSAPFSNSGGEFSGTVRIFKNQNNNWIQIGQNINGEVPFDRAGTSLSISANGNTIAIGARQNDGNGTSSGHVRVFDLSNLLSTEEFTSSTFSFYPNPASTQVTIEIPQETPLEKITIYNSLGQLILSSKNTTINTSTLSQGIYIVEVKTSQGTSSKKLIVE